MKMQSHDANSEVGKWRLNGEQFHSPLVTEQMERSRALHFFDFADVVPKNGDFGEQSPSIRTSRKAKVIHGTKLSNEAFWV